MQSKFKINNLFPIYLLGFLFAFHVALPTYINSSFLNVYISEKLVGIIYILASFFTIFCFLLMPFILKKIGNYKTALSLITFQMLFLFGLAFGNSAFWLIVLFTLSLTIVPLIYFSNDIFLESYSNNHATGKIRGIYLTSVNLAWTISPIVSGFILTKSSYSKIYLISFFLLIPVAIILFSFLNNFKDSSYQATNIKNTIKVIWQNKNISNIVMANWLLFFFYSWMTIYTPIYLYKNIGFSWAQIGIIFSIMLLPFVLFQFIVGWLADKKLGEKELLSLGFIIIAISTGSLSFLNSNNIFLWTIILFLTRVGAGIIEVMCDTYFFKKVDSLNANVISFYRMSSPLAYIFAPLLAVLMLNLFSLNIRYLFLVLSLIMFFGLKFTLALKDTK